MTVHRSLKMNIFKMLQAVTEAFGLTDDTNGTLENESFVSYIIFLLIIEITTIFINPSKEGKFEHRS